MSDSSSTGRHVERVVETVRVTEGGGFTVRRPFPTRSMDQFDPFLMLDHLGPVDYAPGKAIGAPDHPHRGFETVSYILEGSLVHKDSQGHTGVIRAGDVQWMTAGSGVIHSEMPDAAILRDGGRVHGFQIWVNLPKRDKMMHPRYQDVPSAQIPAARSADGGVQVKVIAGEAMGQRAVIDTRTPIMLLHYRLAPRAQATQSAPVDHNVFGYVIRGSGTFGARRAPAREGHAVFFARDADELTFEAGADGLEVLLLGGVPLGEPVARYGPFVMNTDDEIHQAIDDFRRGRMGRIAV